MNIQLEHKEEKFNCEIFNNEKLIHKFGESNLHDFRVDDLPGHLKIYIRPYKIKPIVRIDGIMVNYGLAKITPWDHMLEFKIDRCFFDDYFANIIEAKRIYLGLDEQNIKKKIGLDDLSNLVADIERNLA